MLFFSTFLEENGALRRATLAALQEAVRSGFYNTREICPQLQHILTETNVDFTSPSASPCLRKLSGPPTPEYLRAPREGASAGERATSLPPGADFEVSGSKRRLLLCVCMLNPSFALTYSFSRGTSPMDPEPRLRYLQRLPCSEPWLVFGHFLRLGFCWNSSEIKRSQAICDVGRMRLHIAA